MIKIEGLHKKFGKVQVLDDLNLEISMGGIFAILGPNGSGKTTLIKSMLGMVIPNKGTIEIDGDSVIGKYEHRKNINYLPQIANFPSNLSVEELIKMIGDLRGKASSYRSLIQQFGLEPFLNKKLGHLSGGTRQKVNILLTFMFDSNLIILDEPTSGLDPYSMIQLKDIIKKEKEKGKTILITSHIISFVEEVADKIVFILDGKIYFKGTIDELREKTGQANLEHAIAKILTPKNV
ncbi:ABC transporter ATP-binding protein [Arcticibacterium luteifluviistationis]|uniref:Copper ABC transporter ATP-binding protein n=1 Tax=Arcticibacterium luteifluviistationis TaxID=1784714 RepID=A0A2Z4GFL4_9BACT|nr:ABC transporter ATP-binding protein [Arcticibacterium luteifluviistationis]AWW00041.1 copper ABC transporter ATP-binding protein [Arcticibacterium luteifluviistationis]